MNRELNWKYCEENFIGTTVNRELNWNRELNCQGDCFTDAVDNAYSCPARSVACRIIVYTWKLRPDNTQGASLRVIGQYRKVSLVVC